MLLHVNCQTVTDVLKNHGPSNPSHNHSTPYTNRTTYNGNLWANMAFSAAQNLSFWEFTYSVRWNKHCS